jgi:hypothetical protein
MSRNHLRAFVGAFVALLVLIGGGLMLATNGNDPESTAVAADAPPSEAPTTAPSTEAPAAPVDAEEVIEDAQRAEQARVDQQLQDYAAAVTQAENEAALEALAQAEREASSGIPDSYWDRMAQCETGGDWTMVGSRYSGGLGFYNGTWDSFGGREFAARAGQATREQQIIVANRVANDVGISGWGCLSHVGRP